VHRRIRRTCMGVEQKGQAVRRIRLRLGPPRSTELRPATKPLHEPGALHHSNVPVNQATEPRGGSILLHYELPRPGRRRQPAPATVGNLQVLNPRGSTSETASRGRTAWHSPARAFCHHSAAEPGIGSTTVRHATNDQMSAAAPHPLQPALAAPACQGLRRTPTVSARRRHRLRRRSADVRDESPSAACRLTGTRAHARAKSRPLLSQPHPNENRRRHRGHQPAQGNCRCGPAPLRRRPQTHPAKGPSRAVLDGPA